MARLLICYVATVNGDVGLVTSAVLVVRLKHAQASGRTHKHM